MSVEKTKMEPSRTTQIAAPPHPDAKGPDAHQPEQKDSQEIEKKSAEKSSLTQKENSKRKKLTLNGTDYLVVSIEEVNEYAKIKEKYKNDSMSAFILYMHTGFISDLASIRRKGKLQSILFYCIVVLCIVVSILGMMLLLKFLKR